MNLQAEHEKVNAVSQVRNEAKEEIAKMKDKIQEVTCEYFIRLCQWIMTSTFEFFFNRWGTTVHKCKNG